MANNNNFYIGGNNSTPQFRKNYSIVFENDNKELLIINYNGEYEIIGYSKNYVDELQNICLEHKQKKEEYYNLLLENQIIEKEMTQEAMSNIIKVILSFPIPNIIC